MKKMNYLSAFVIACLAFTMNVTVQGAEFVRVDADLSDWTGEYLIVHEASSKAFNSVLEGPTGPLDATMNAIDVTIVGDEIAADETTDAIKVTIYKVDDGWSIQTASGFYIGNSGTTNTLMAATEFKVADHTNTIMIDAEGYAVITPPETSRAMRFNSGETNQRFCYFAATGQQPVALYKRNAPGAPVFSVDETPKPAGWQANSAAKINVTGNVAWTASVTAGGTYASITSGASGTGGGAVTVTFTENTSEDPREATVTISTTAAVTTKSYAVKITQSGASTKTFVRVDATPAGNNWAGKYLIVYEAQAGPGAGTYGAKTVIAFNGKKEGEPVNGANNGIILSPTTPGSPEDLAALTGGTVVRNTDPDEVTVTGGEIEWTQDLEDAAVTIAAFEDGWSIKTTGGYYLGWKGDGPGGDLGASETFVPENQVHTISIGETNSNATQNVIFYNCAIIQCKASEGAHNTFRINGNTGRFGYWGLAGGTEWYGQHPVALYKLSDLETGLNSPKAQSDIMVYLTAGGDAIVKSVAAIRSLTVVSISGAVLSREQFPNSGETSCRINMQSFPAGVYIVNIETPEGITAKKLIKN